MTTWHWCGGGGGGAQHNTSFQQHHLHWSDMSFIHHAIAKKIKEDKESNKLVRSRTEDSPLLWLMLLLLLQEPEESPIKTVLGSLARNSLASDTLSVQNMNNSNNYRRKKKKTWKPISIEDVPFRRQDRMTLNARNRIDRDKKLIFFIVGMGVLLIFIGLLLLLLYRLYSDDIKDLRPVIVIGRNHPPVDI